MKSCPKCRGQVFPDKEIGTGYLIEFCIQCGYRKYQGTVMKFAKPKRGRGRPRKNKQKECWNANEVVVSVGA